MATPRWQPLMVRGALSPKLAADATDASGVYAVREAKSHAVVYVGESSRGRLWKTLLRHFQAPESFAAVRERGIFTGDPAKYEVAIEVTSRGPRPRPPADGSPESTRIKELRARGVRFTTEADQRALDLQAEWIENLSRAGHKLINQDDGRAVIELVSCSECGGDGEDLLGDDCKVCGGTGRVQASNPKPKATKVEQVTTRQRVPLASIRHEPVWEPAKLVALERDPVAAAKPVRLTRSDDGSIWIIDDGIHRIARARALGATDIDAITTEFLEPAKRGAKAVCPACGHAPKVRRSSASNPSSSSSSSSIPAMPLPVSGLVELGVLTRLEMRDGAVFVWNLRDAPVLAYDKRGALFVVYPGRVVRPSNPAELRSYARTHWGARGRGDCRGGGTAVGPFVSHGPSTSITYTTRKGGDAALVDYVHAWGEGGRGKFTAPTVVEHACERRCGSKCEAKGSLALAGGSYVVSDRGIVG